MRPLSVLGDAAFAREGARADHGAIMISVPGQVVDGDFGVWKGRAQQGFQVLDRHGHWIFSFRSLISISPARPLPARKASVCRVLLAVWAKARAKSARAPSGWVPQLQKGRSQNICLSERDRQGMRGAYARSFEGKARGLGEFGNAHCAGDVDKNAISENLGAGVMHCSRKRTAKRHSGVVGGRMRQVEGPQNSSRGLP